MFDGSTITKISATATGSGASTKTGLPGSSAFNINGASKVQATMVTSTSTAGANRGASGPSANAEQDSSNKKNAAAAARPVRYAGIWITGMMVIGVFL